MSEGQVTHPRATAVFKVESEIHIPVLYSQPPTLPIEILTKFMLDHNNRIMERLRPE